MTFRLFSLCPLFVLAFVALCGHASAQTAPVRLSASGGALPPHAERLGDDSRDIGRDNLLNERLLDLVEVRSLDSLLGKRRIKHRFWGIRMPWLIGLRWERLDPAKRKFVGTCRNDLHQYVFGSSNEHDVNFDLVPHLPQYVDVLYRALDFQFGSGRSSLITDRRAKGRARDRLWRVRRLHCECTPPYDHHRLLDSLVYPVLDGNTLVNHPNFREPKPSIGLYGPLVADCNHTCHPEIHPYEWLWWRDLHDAQSPGHQVWFALFLRDDSQRMKAWQKGPRLGEISLPLVFSLEKKEWLISIRHLIHTPVEKPSDNLLGELVAGQPAETFDGPSAEVPVTVEGAGEHILVLRQEGPAAKGQWKYRLGEWAVDPVKKIAFVRLHLYVAAQNLYAVRVEAGK